jgi:hypothetical protein
MGFVINIHTSCVRQCVTRFWHKIYHGICSNNFLVLVLVVRNLYMNFMQILTKYMNRSNIIFRCCQFLFQISLFPSKRGVHVYNEYLVCISLELSHFFMLF